MTRLNWSDANSRIFEVGLDRGVLYPKAGPAVPWYGLTGVEEEGADSAKAYYMDGRPYLIVPQPKEFQATVKAYTYPDAFSELMGVVEATDGMYVDSQQGDAFDLSYRTLIGDGVKGTEAGYKIHLVYNAVVAPQGISYGSVGSSIDPSEFSWEIQAWPMPLVGFRSSAHIVIDTRHMDSNKLTEIEDLLYGSASTEAAAPAPQVIFDTLNHGDAIIITDNGDGTWEASGSYKNIYLIDDGVFTIDNVDGQDNGDGTFTISTTL